MKEHLILPVCGAILGAALGFGLIGAGIGFGAGLFLQTSLSLISKRLQNSWARAEKEADMEQEKVELLYSIYKESIAPLKKDFAYDYKNGRSTKIKAILCEPFRRNPTQRNFVIATIDHLKQTSEKCHTKKPIGIKFLQESTKKLEKFKQSRVKQLFFGTLKPNGFRNMAVSRITEPSFPHWQEKIFLRGSHQRQMAIREDLFKLGAFPVNALKIRLKEVRESNYKRMTSTKP
jgi:hypothetical protein